MADLDLAPQFANLQDTLEGIGSPPGPVTSPQLGADADSWLSSPWLWVALAALLLVALWVWYKWSKDE